jgi:hypothetical protein
MPGSCGKIHSTIQTHQSTIQVYCPKHFWLTCSITAIIGICYVTTQHNAFAETIQTIVDIAHAPAKARDGEQY